MENGKFSTVIALVAWLLLMPLLWLTTWVKPNVHSFLTYSTFLYLIALPFGMVRFVEKKSCIERFGIQASRFLVLVILILTSLSITYLSGVVDSGAFLSIVLAPISEEVFFRGYLMGRFRNEKTLNSIVRSIAIVFLTSIVFALSHIFKYDLMGVFFIFGLSSITCALPYLFTGSILLSLAFHTCYNFWTVVKEGEFMISAYLLFIPILMPAILLSITEWVRRRKRSRANTVFS